MNVLIIYPHGNALDPLSGASTRIWNLINTLVNYNCKISILHSYKSRGLENTDLRNKVKVYYYRDLEFFGISDWYLTDFNPFYIFKLLLTLKLKTFDIIQVEYPWGFLIAKLFAKKKSIIIYDSLGVESQFIEVAMKHPKFPKGFKILAKIYAKIYEKIVCKLANAIINVSEVDREYYIKNYKINKSKTVLIQISSSVFNSKMPLLSYSKSELRKKLNLPLDKTIIVFHGSLPHPPNQEAINLILKYISPKIKNPDIRFIIAGKNLEKFHKNNIISLGFVKDIKELLLSADFAIVPIISGSGMRVKCSDYISAALPFITTKKGIEGINQLKNGFNCIICDDVNEKFLDSINFLHDDKIFREKLKKNLNRLSKSFYSGKYEKKLIYIYKKLLNDLHK